MRLMSYKVNLLSAFFAFVLSINLFSQEISETSKYEYFKKSNYSLEELGYHKCDQKLFRDSIYKKRKDPVFTDQVTPENFKHILMRKMCYYPNRQYMYYEDLDYDEAVISFLKKYSTEMPHCDNASIKDKCFGAGLYHAGLYLGEWHNNYPNGRGIALITNNFPIMGKGDRETNKEAIYEGEFKNGYPHGLGSYDNGYHTYEGNWVNGERHGEIGWYLPRVFVFGFNYDRDVESELIRITSITEGSSAEINKILVGDLIYAFQLNERDKIQYTNETSFNKFSKMMKESEDLILYINGLDNKVTLKKSLLKVTFDNPADCAANPNREFGCYEKAFRINKYTTKNTPYEYGRGSFFMGREHMYNSSDYHRYTYKNDETPGEYSKIFCDGASLPFTASFLDPRKNFVPLEGFKDVFVPPNFNDVACGYGSILLYPELILDNDILLEQAWKEIKLNTDKLIKIDFIDLLENAVNDKNNLQLFDESKIDKIRNPVNYAGLSDTTYSGAHILCSMSVTISTRACLNNNTFGGSYKSERVERIREKVALNPQTKAYENMLQMKLERAKFNLATIKLCIDKQLQRNIPNDYEFNDCLHSLIFGNFWKCKYYGYSDFSCLNQTNQSFRKTYGNVNDFIKNHPEQFENIDYNEWVFGKELEL